MAERFSPVNPFKPVRRSPDVPARRARDEVGTTKKGKSLLFRLVVSEVVPPITPA
jgi:hypothetical protein